MAGWVWPYCAPTIALAVLETAAHVDDAGLPPNRFLVELHVPDEVWALHQTVSPATLPPTWSAIPAGMGSVQFGAHWLASNSGPILLVPSVIVPEEHTALLNPAHPAARHITATVLRPFSYNALFRAA